jgi:hypothetical protein
LVSTVKVVFALRVDHAEDSVGIAVAMDVRDAPIVASDGDACSLGVPACEVSGRRGREGRRAAGEQECVKDEALCHVSQLWDA